jgi:hypothetical protein
MRLRALTIAMLAGLIVAWACQADDKPQNQQTAKPAESKRVPFNKSGTLILETFPDGKRRVLLKSQVVFREGPLELLMCKYQSKEHESILHADVDGKDLHALLIVAQAKPGSPVTYKEKPNKDFEIIPPTGTRIRVLLEYEKKPGEMVTVNARDWIKDVKSKKELAHDWVFAGSGLFQDPDDKTRPPYYLANGSGDFISVSNFQDSIMDLPVPSTKDNADLQFECWTERIPAIGTKVLMILEPVLDDGKKNDDKKK